MPIYTVLMNGTEKAMADPKAVPSRVQAAREFIEKLGGKLLDWNLTMGLYEAVAPKSNSHMTIALLLLNWLLQKLVTKQLRRGGLSMNQN